MANLLKQSLEYYRTMAEKETNPTIKAHYTAQAEIFEEKINQKNASDNQKNLNKLEKEIHRGDLS